MPRPPARPRLSFILRHAGIAFLAAALCGCQFLRPSPEQEIATNPCIVLALPSSGPYSPVSAKIRRGAETAAKQLAQQGVQVHIENINTAAPDWLTRLSALPESCAIVGGPLQEKTYMEARKAGALGQRAFFAFMPTLAQGDEGRLAWRYFPSPHDQVDALLNFATDQMGIRAYGAFYPSDNYGRRMTEIMQAALQKRGLSLQKAAYNPKAPATWSASVAPLINPRRGSDGKTMVPQTTFEALFIPDSFKNLDGITTSMLVNGEDRLALLGTTLWEQNLAGKQVPKAEKYALAVFPGAWNREKAPASMKNGDFWSALGYDFVNFGEAVGLAKRLDAQLVTDRALRSAQTGRAMAPLHYDNNGIAHQTLYLFQISPGGMTPLDAGRFRQSRTAAAERAALRMQGFGHIDPDTGEVVDERADEREDDDDGPLQEATPAASQASAQPAQEASVVPAATPASGQESPQGASIAPASSHAPEKPLVREAPAAIPLRPATGGGVMRDGPRPSYKLSLPGKK